MEQYTILSISILQCLSRMLCSFFSLPPWPPQHVHWAHLAPSLNIFCRAHCSVGCCIELNMQQTCSGLFFRHLLEEQELRSSRCHSQLNNHSVPSFTAHMPTEAHSLSLPSHRSTFRLLPNCTPRNVVLYFLLPVLHVNQHGHSNRCIRLFTSLDQQTQIT